MNMRDNHLFPALSLWKRIALYVVTAAMTVLIVLDLIHPLVTAPQLFRYIIYAVAAFGLVASCVYLIKDIGHILNHGIRPLVARYAFTSQLASDYRFRSAVFAIPALGVTMVYAVFNTVIAFLSSSWWYLALAAYYLILSLMRYGILRIHQKETRLPDETGKRLRSWMGYRNCGLMLIVLSVVLAGIVGLIYLESGEKHYPGVLIYAAAVYTFYKLAKAILHMFRARKENAPVLMSLRSIGYADALVSLLTLQVALFSAFPPKNQAFRTVMNLFTGILVCLMTTGIGIGMTVVGSKGIRESI